MKNKTIEDTPLLIHSENGNKSGTEELKNCRIVFISQSDNAPAIIRILQDLPIVTVCAPSNFVNKGGLISLVKDGKCLSFEIHLDAANASNIPVSAKLLKLAKMVPIAK